MDWLVYKTSQGHGVEIYGSWNVSLLQLKKTLMGTLPGMYFSQDFSSTWNIFKVFTEFVTMQLLFYEGFEILVPLPGMEPLHTSCTGRQSLRHSITREVPIFFLNQSDGHHLDLVSEAWGWTISMGHLHQKHVFRVGVKRLLKVVKVQYT